jgi:hypothetical protein
MNKFPPLRAVNLYAVSARVKIVAKKLREKIAHFENTHFRVRQISQNGVRKHFYAKFSGGQCNNGTPFDDDGILIDFLDVTKFCKFPWAPIGPIS